MKILHLLYESRGDYFGTGGVGTRAYEIYKHLKNRHEITLLCRKYPGAKDREIEGLKHVFFGAESKSFTKALLSYAFNAALFVKRYGDGFDIIIEEFSPAIPTFLHFFTKKPVVLQIQGCTGGLYFRKYNPAYASMLYFLEKLRPLFYDNFIFISQETVKRFSKGGMGRLFALKGSKCIEIIPNGISSEMLSVIPEENNYILYFGRIDIYAKGLDILIDAYKDFCKSFPEIRLFIAGDGREMKEFKDMLVKLPDDSRRNIELLGWVSGDKKIEVISKALFVVLPSRHEVQPISILEQMACGKAIITSNIPELSHITKNIVGISFKSGDAVALAQAMKDLTVRKDIREMGQRGRDLVKDLTWDKIALRFETFLERARKK
ncbi:MAG: glycosyltransferase family 4 protein [Nitrospirae bacterium]|nr:glycosyltransferase family 4 protein [Nitrospirota bacterium]